MSWPKGSVTAPTFADQLHYFFADNRTALVAAAGLIVLLAYYLLVWSAVGRDPAPGPIMVRYEPPQGLSPAGMRFLARMGFDQTTFAAATLNLAVKRFLTIRHDAGGYTLVRVPGAKLENIAGLAAEERVLARRLLDSAAEVDLSAANYKVVQAATKATRETLRAAEEKIYFLTNSRYVLPGLALSAAALGAAMFSLPGQQIAISAFMSVWLTGWSAGVFALTAAAVAGWRKYFADGSSTAMLGALLISLFGLPFWGGEIFGLYTLIHGGSAWFAILLAVLVGTNILFHYLLKAPTRAGRALLDQVEGFKQYFLAVERDPMQRLSEPEITPERFEKYLPYAVALGVEKAWSARFAAALAQAGKPQAQLFAHLVPGKRFQLTRRRRIRLGSGNDAFQRSSVRIERPGLKLGRRRWRQFRRRWWWRWRWRLVARKQVRRRFRSCRLSGAVRIPRARTRGYPGRTSHRPLPD